MGRRHRDAERAERVRRREERAKEQAYLERWSKWADALPLDMQWELEDVAVRGREEEFKRRAAYFGWQE